MGQTTSRLLKHAVHFGYKRGVFEKKEARQTGRVLDRAPSLAEDERRKVLPAVNEVLAEIGFAEEVHRLCRPVYSQRAMADLEWIRWCI